MIILNTTFVIHAPLQDEFLKWVRETYLHEALKTGIFHDPAVARVLTRIEPDTESFAVQMRASDGKAAQMWHDGGAAELRNELHSRWNDRILFFTTYMEVIE